jgi:hypothetical protein
MRNSRWRDRVAVAGGFLLLGVLSAAIIVGGVEIARFVLLLVANLVTHAHVSLNGSWLQDLYSTLEQDGQRHPAADKIAAAGAVCTALFTLMLWRVTGSMGRASHRQAAGDFPLLRVDLSIDAAPVRSAADAGTASATEKHPAKSRAAYPAYLQELDDALFERSVLSNAPARYVRVRVENVQKKPFAVARDVAVTVAVDMPGGIDALVRRLEVELLPPERWKKRPLFDIGPLEQVQASVIDVEYRDLRGRRRRRAAYGQLTVTLQKDGTVSGLDGYSRPDRWEMP